MCRARTFLREFRHKPGCEPRADNDEKAKRERKRARENQPNNSVSTSELKERIGELSSLFRERPLNPPVTSSARRHRTHDRVNPDGRLVHAAILGPRGFARIACPADPTIISCRSLLFAGPAAALHAFHTHVRIGPHRVRIVRNAISWVR